MQCVDGTDCENAACRWHGCQGRRPIRSLEELVPDTALVSADATIGGIKDDDTGQLVRRRYRAFGGTFVE